MKTRIIKKKGSYQIQHIVKHWWSSKWIDSCIDIQTGALVHNREACDTMFAKYYPDARFIEKSYAKWKLYPTKQYDHLEINCYKSGLSTDFRRKQ